MSATLTKELNEEETEQVYRDLCDYINSLSFGYLTNDEGLKEQGADLAMLKEFFTVQDALYVLDMPKDDFFTVDWFAEKENMADGEAEEILRDMAKRGIVYREMRDDGQMWYHNAPAAHGVFEFHAGEAMNAGWLGPLFATLGSGTLQICYDAGVPFYRAVPISKDVVKDQNVLPDDDIFERIKEHRRICVSPCACLDAVRDNLGVHNCDHAKGVCLQTDKMADYYLDDLNLGHEITVEQAEKIMHKCVDEGLCIQTTYAKDNEIICFCNICHCGILPALKNWPGDAAEAVSNYRVVCDYEQCDKSGACVAACPMQSIELNDDGYPEVVGSCVGCGQCVAACPTHARILVQKDNPVSYPDSVWDTYVIMEENRRKKGQI